MAAERVHAARVNGHRQSTTDRLKAKRLLAGLGAVRPNR